MVKLFFYFRVLLRFGFDQYFAFNITLSDRFEIWLVSDELIIIHDHIELVERDSKLFTDELFKTIYVLQDINSEKLLLAVLHVFDKECLDRLHSNILIDLKNLFVSVDNFLKQTDHFFDTA